MKSISVIVPTYKRETLLRRSLDSIIFNAPDEIIVVNDDPTELKEINTKQNYKLIQHRENQGLSAARNSGISMAVGDYISFCDDDDEWMPEYLNTVRPLLDGQREIIIALDKKYEWLLPRRELFLSEILQLGVTPPVSAQVYNVNLTKRVKFDTRVKSGIDLDFWIRLLDVNPKVTVIFGDYVRQQTHSGERITTDLFKRISGLEKTINIWDSDLKNNSEYQKLRKKLINGYVKYLQRAFYKEIFWSNLTLRNLSFLGCRLSAFSGLLDVIFRGLKSKILGKKNATF